MRSHQPTVPTYYNLTYVKASIADVCGRYCLRCNVHDVRGNGGPMLFTRRLMPYPSVALQVGFRLQG